MKQAGISLFVILLWHGFKLSEIVTRDVNYIATGGLALSLVLIGGYYKAKSKPCYTTVQQRKRESQMENYAVGMGFCILITLVFILASIVSY